MHTSIIDNQGENTLYKALQNITESGHELWVATAFFSLDALNMMGERLDQCKNVRLLFGDDAAPTQRAKLLQAMRERSDADLLKRRETDPLLRGLQYAKKLIEEKRLESRVYTKDKFHAKLYLAFVPGFQGMHGILGSGNFTRPGLTQNIELNVHLSLDQAGHLKDWYDVWLDKAQTIGFEGVPESTWNFHIGGYQVCEKWLKDRSPKKGKPGRTLTPGDIEHYHYIAFALTETQRLMKEIDQAIETHGGWPGAFQGGGE